MKRLMSLGSVLLALAAPFGVATLFAFVSATPALAAMHTITVKNPDGSRIWRLSVRHATVVDFQPTNATEFPVKIDLPDEAYCNPIVRVSVDQDTPYEFRLSICQDQGFTIRDK